MPKHRILIVDDERAMREFLEIMLRKEGYDAMSMESAAKALEFCKENYADLVITDLKMPGMNGVEFTRALKELDPSLLVIMVTAYASVETAIDAMKAGAYDYFTKPFKLDEIKLNIRNALSFRNLKRENERLRKAIKSRNGIANLIGESHAMEEVHVLIRSISRAKANVFITGESGTGKELVARAIHYEGIAANGGEQRPFVATNCGAIPETRMQTEP